MKRKCVIENNPNESNKRICYQDSYEIQESILTVESGMASKKSLDEARSRYRRYMATRNFDEQLLCKIQCFFELHDTMLSKKSKSSFYSEDEMKLFSSVLEIDTELAKKYNIL